MDTTPRFPVVTLTTDFGLSDHYVGTMKGVILTLCPDAVLVDISHGVPAFSIMAGAYTIAQAAPFFPPGTVHVVVIDPGVGTARKAIVVEALHQVFIAPDNGVLSLIAAKTTEMRVREITNRELWLPQVSSTFHGRDIFAAVAGALAAGGSTSRVGLEIQGMELLPNLQPRQTGERTWQGLVLSIDHFGNVITNFPVAEFPAVAQGLFTITASGRSVRSFYPTFGNALNDECFAYFGSSGFIEIGLKGANAAGTLQLRPGMPVEISLDQ